MGRPEILTSAVLAVVGLGFALWLAANRVPQTPVMPGEIIEAAPALAALPSRSLPRATGAPAVPDIALGPNGLPCGPMLSVAPGAAGFAAVALSAPCRVGEVAVFAHGPIRFAERVSPRGTVLALVPVAGPSDGFTAEIGEVRLEADGLAKVMPRRMSGLSWSAPVDLALVASEFGAARQLRAGETAGMGQVVRLGDARLGAATEIYVGPEAVGPGVVRLDVAATPTASHCEDPVAVAAFERRASELIVRDIRLTLGACEDPMRPVLLKNLIEDMKIAGR